MRTYTVAVLGATGAVGREMIRILEERSFPVGKLLPLASARSAGTTIPFRGEEITVSEVTPDVFAGVDIVLGAAPNKLAKEYAPHIVKAGAVFVDNSSAFRLYDDVPLVIPEINPEDVKRHNGIISNPNCSTIVSLVAVNAINKLSPIKAMTVSTYQAVSGAGAGGPVELQAQVDAIANGDPVETKIFPYQIAYNLIPQIGDFTENGYTTEEMKMQNEGRKILHLPELLVGCTCVRVPVFRSHSISITLATETPISVEDAKRAIATAQGCHLVDDPTTKSYPMPLDTSDQDIVFVGRIRKDLTNPNGLTLWCCGDQVRKGAATNTVQIAELLIR
ncbi:MAG: aspartate-semialdehyde dehydrogenase [Clostridia bacterium]|nr:aspartate-semialdehyde dehydrogenase [Clostridia bacterium]